MCRKRGRNKRTKKQKRIIMDTKFSSLAKTKKRISDRVPWTIVLAFTLDYSSNSIIYDFKENNVLIVSGEVDDIDDYRGHEMGIYSYKMLPIPSPEHAGAIYLPQIEIDTKTYGVSFGWVFFDSYEGNAMHINTENGTLILVKVDKTVKTK